MRRNLIGSARMWRRVVGVAILSITLNLAVGGPAVSADAGDSSATTWQQFLADRPELLRTLAPPIIDCFKRRDTTSADFLSPIFHGCIDWHSSVHAAYSHHALYRRTGDRIYLDLVENQISPLGISLIPAESQYQQNGVDAKGRAIRTRENPYGFAWFLVLAREREQSTGVADFREMANFTATEMIRWFQTRSGDGLEPFNYILQADHPNWSWALINLDEWARYTNDEAILTAVREAATPLLDPRLDTECGDATRDAGGNPGGSRGFNFMPPCLMRLAAVAHVFGNQAKNWIVARLPEGGLYVPPVTAPGDCHAGGLNFFRAFALYQIYLGTGDTRYRDNYAELIRYHVGRPDLYAENYNCYAHWVAQVGVRAISLSYEAPQIDLTPTAATPSKSRVTGSDQVTFSTHVQNNGSGDADSVVVRFELDGVQLGDDKTISSLSAGASATVTSDAWAANHEVGSHTVQVVVDPADAIAEISETNNAAAAAFEVVRSATALAYTGEATADYDDPATLSATLVDAENGEALVGRAVDFSLGAQGCAATTDAVGVASCQVTLAQASGTYPLAASYAGEFAFEPSSAAGEFVVTPEETTLAYTGDTLLANGGGARLSGVLKEDGVVPIDGRPVTFTLGGSQSCTGTTDGSGQASCTIGSVSQPNGPGDVSAGFAGDAFYEVAAVSASTLVYDFAPGGGAFVIGDGNAAAGSSVTFWGSQWPKLNTLSGGPAPSSFKGFAHTPARPACGTSWVGDPGHDSPPPAPLPAYIGVIVASAATGSSSSTVTGNTTHVVVVRTNPGYQPDPAHLGTGTVVATTC